MNSWLSQPLFSFLLLGFISALFAVGWVLMRQTYKKDPNKKIEEDKALLKKLLDDFGLEIPSELEEAHSSAIKSVKTLKS